MIPLPEDICYKASPAEDYDGNARLVVRVVDYRTAYNRIVYLESQVAELRACVLELVAWGDYDVDHIEKLDWSSTRAKAIALIGEGGE